MNTQLCAASSRPSRQRTLRAGAQIKLGLLGTYELHFAVTLFRGRCWRDERICLRSNRKGGPQLTYIHNAWSDEVAGLTGDCRRIRPFVCPLVQVTVSRVRILVGTHLCARDTSEVKGKMVKELGGAADMLACTVRTTGVLSNRTLSQFLCRYVWCTSYVRFPFTSKIVTYAKRTDLPRLQCLWLISEHGRAWRCFVRTDITMGWSTIQGTFNY
jgi:hypothetical protein